MFYIFLLGPAGSGKSTLAAALYDWLLSNDIDTIIVNLDPGVDWLPYKPDVDARDYVTVEDVMEKYNLGPNGAIIAATDLLAVDAENIKDEIESLKADYAIVDTPGQLELFAFRSAGEHLSKTLVSGGGALSLFLVDIVFASKPSSLVSMLLLSYSVRFRLLLPQVLVLSKCDMVDERTVDYIVHLIENPAELLNAISNELKGMYRQLSESICQLLDDIGYDIEVVPTSAVKGKGLDILYSIAQRISAGGEDYVTYY